jgi:hypothetical protein
MLARKQNDIPRENLQCSLNQIAGIIRIRGITKREVVQLILMATEQFTQCTRISASGGDDEFFIASLPTATFNIEESRAMPQINQKRQFWFSCLLHFIPPYAQ